MRLRLEHLLIILMLCAGAAAAALGVFAFSFARYEQEHRAREKLTLLSGEGAALAGQIDRHLSSVRGALLASAAAVAPDAAAVRGAVAREPLFYRGFIYDLAAHRLVYPSGGITGFEDLFTTMIGSGTDENPVLLGVNAAPPQMRALSFAAGDTDASSPPAAKLHAAEAMAEAPAEPAADRLQRLVPRIEGFMRRDRSGVIAWHAGDRWSPLVWANSGDPRFVCGFELDSVVLLSKLVPLLPPRLPEGFRLELCGSSGKAVCVAGGEIPDGAEPQVAGVFPLSNGLLENCQVRALLLPSGADRAVLRPAVWTFLAALCLAILLSGGGALYLARREMKLSRLRTGFVSQVSHELKTPLTGIRLHSELLQNPELSESGRGRSLNAITAECERLSRLVDNVLDFSRIERRRKNYAPRRIELREFLRGFRDDSAAGIPLDIQLELPPAPVFAVIDPDSLVQVLRNLADNAAKYAASGKKLVIELRPGAIRVRDFGPGVPAAKRKRIFRRFYRVDDRLTAVSGSGLGLSIARRLMRDQRGDLRSLPCDGGACFEIVMPTEDKNA